MMKSVRSHLHVANGILIVLGGLKYDQSDTEILTK